jgi:hypothetical protein
MHEHCLDHQRCKGKHVQPLAEVSALGLRDQITRTYGKATVTCRSVNVSVSYAHGEHGKPGVGTVALMSSLNRGVACQATCSRAAGVSNKVNQYKRMQNVWLRKTP